MAYSMILVSHPLVFLFVLVNLLSRFGDFDAILLLHFHLLCVQHFYAAFVLLSGLHLINTKKELQVADKDIHVL